MGATSFYHGVTTTIVDVGPRTIAVPSSSVVGLVDTYAPGADLVQPDVPVRLTSEHDAAQAFGENSAVARAARAIFAQSKAAIVAVGVEKKGDAAQLATDVIGGVSAAGRRTGL